MKMQHPASKQTIDVAPESAAMYRSQGWTQVGAKKAAPAKKAAAKRASSKNRASTPADNATNEGAQS